MSFENHIRHEDDDLHVTCFTQADLDRVREEARRAAFGEIEEIHGFANTIFRDYEPGSRAYSFALRVMEMLPHENGTSS